MEIKDKLVEAIVKGIQEKKGQNITIADLRGIDGNIASYFVICQGNSPSQVEAITGWQWTTWRLSCTSSYPKHATTITLRTSGRTLRLRIFRISINS